MYGGEWNGATVAATWNRAGCPAHTGWLLIGPQGMRCGDNTQCKFRPHIRVGTVGVLCSQLADCRRFNVCRGWQAGMSRPIGMHDPANRKERWLTVLGCMHGGRVHAWR